MCKDRTKRNNAHTTWSQLTKLWCDIAHTVWKKKDTWEEHKLTFFKNSCGMKVHWTSLEIHTPFTLRLVLAFLPVTHLLPWLNYPRFSWSGFFTKITPSPSISNTFTTRVRKCERHQSEARCANVKAGPVEATLVIFGRRALIFFRLKAFEKNEEWHTFVRMRRGDHLGDAKMSKKGTSLRRI